MQAYLLHDFKIEIGELALGWFGGEPEYEPMEKRDTSQLELLESYTGQLRQQLYGLDFPL